MTLDHWPADGLINELRYLDKLPDRRFVFVLGAGASSSSGIPTGDQMARSWLERLQKHTASKEPLDKWATEANLSIPGFEFSRYAEFYPQIFQKAFGDDHEAGYDTLEKVMAGKRPSVGYTLLAQVMATTRHNIVITTNFDNLMADALSSLGGPAPLICGHESLATYARVRAQRPLILKVHRDLLLDPINDVSGTTTLHPGFAEALKRVLHQATLVVLGYGGNDGSLMGFLEDLPTGSIPGRIFWCGRGTKPSTNQQVIRVL